MILTNIFPFMTRWKSCLVVRDLSKDTFQYVIYVYRSASSHDLDSYTISLLVFVFFSSAFFMEPFVAENMEKLKIYGDLVVKHEASKPVR